MRWVSLGFLLGVRFMVRVEFCVPFQRFGNIRSTQPTGLGAYRKPQMRWVSLGFFLGVRFMVRVEFCVPFQRFGSIRSTQPTGLIHYGIKFLNFIKFVLQLVFHTAEPAKDAGIVLWSPISM